MIFERQVLKLKYWWMTDKKTRKADKRAYNRLVFDFQDAWDIRCEALRNITKPYSLLVEQVKDGLDADACVIRYAKGCGVPGVNEKCDQFKGDVPCGSASCSMCDANHKYVDAARRAAKCDQRVKEFWAERMEMRLK